MFIRVRCDRVVSVPENRNEVVFSGRLVIAAGKNVEPTRSEYAIFGDFVDAGR